MNTGVIDGLHNPYKSPDFDDPNDPMWAGGDIGYDLEFNEEPSGLMLPRNWEYQNQGGLTFTRKLGKGQLTMTGSATSQVSFAGHSLPPAPFTLTSKLQVDGSNAAVDWTAGFSITNGTKYANWGVRYNGQLGGNYWNAYNSWASDNHNGNTWAGGTLARPLYFRMVYTSASSVAIYYSLDAMKWLTCWSAQNLTAGSFMTTPTKLGLHIVQYGGAPAVSITMDWWRVRLGLNVPE